MEKSKLTAVEWFLSSLAECGLDLSQYVLEIQEAKELDRQNIIDAYTEGMGHYGGANSNSDAKQYYNETFNK